MISFNAPRFSFPRAGGYVLSKIGLTGLQDAAVKSIVMHPIVSECRGVVIDVLSVLLQRIEAFYS